MKKPNRIIKGQYQWYLLLLQIAFDLKDGKDLGFSVEDDRIVLWKSLNASERDEISFTIVATDSYGHAAEQAVAFKVCEPKEVNAENLDNVYTARSFFC